jgi:hypothetical protein
MKISLHFNAKVERKYASKPTIGNESLHEISNDNGVRVVQIATSNFVKSTLFPQSNIQTFTNVLALFLTRRHTARLIMF